jgi:hypothetical protein
MVDIMTVLIGYHMSGKSVLLLAKFVTALTEQTHRLRGRVLHV